MNLAIKGLAIIHIILNFYRRSRSFSTDFIIGRIQDTSKKTWKRIGTATGPRLIYE